MTPRPTVVPPLSPPLRALVVDDESEYGQVLADTLSHGYEVTATTSAEIGLRYIRSNRPHAVVLEAGVGDMRKVISVISELRELLPTSAIMVTARAPLRVREIVECFEVGADDYLPKPLHPRELLARVNRRVRLSGHGE